MSKEITNLKKKAKTNNVKRNFQFPKIDKEISKFSKNMKNDILKFYRVKNSRVMKNLKKTPAFLF